MILLRLCPKTKFIDQWNNLHFHMHINVIQTYEFDVAIPIPLALIGVCEDVCKLIPKKKEKKIRWRREKIKINRRWKFTKIVMKMGAPMNPNNVQAFIIIILKFSNSLTIRASNTLEADTLQTNTDWSHNRTIVRQLWQTIYWWCFCRLSESFSDRKYFVIYK